MIIKCNLSGTKNMKFCCKVAKARRQVQIRSTNWEIMSRGEEWKTGEKSSKSSLATQRV